MNTHWTDPLVISSDQAFHGDTGEWVCYRFIEHSSELIVYSVHALSKDEVDIFYLKNSERN